MIIMGKPGTSSARPFLLGAIIFTVLASPAPLRAAMNDYCVVPPYVVQNIQPNVMLVVDTSGSMFNFAYTDGFQTPTTTDDHSCTSSDPCTGYLDPMATDNNYKYYGYFDPDSWYTYNTSGSKFVVSRLKSAGSKTSTEWDGSFLNWVTMRRIDVLRRVLTGGKKGTGEGTGFDRIEGEKADCDSRGTIKTHNATAYTPYSGNKTFTVSNASAGCGGGGSGISSFTVSGVAGSFNVRVVLPSPVQGVLQDVVGARARLGLTFYNTNEGGNVRVNLAGGSLSSTVNEINNTRPFTNTPLAETLWTVTGYFAKQTSLLGGPGPRYSTSDYGVSNSVDPLNYGQGTPRWPTCSKSFVLFITDGEPCSDGNLPATLADYASGRSDFNCNGGSCPSVPKPDGGSFAASTFPTCGAGGYVAGIEDVALYMHTTDLRSDIANTQNLTLYSVFAFGKGSSLLRYAAINGGFEDNGSHVPYPQDTWDKNGDGEPDTFFEAADGQELEQSIRDAFSGILKRASSGTAASVLASGEGSGANLIQAVFYPRRAVGSDIIWWTGALQNMWYYVDPFFANATIREDTTQDNYLNLGNDDIVQFYFNPVTQLTEVKRWHSDNTGLQTTQDTTVSFENLGSLWEAGKKLWQRNLSSDARTLKTSLDGSNLIDFSVANAGTLGPYLLETGDNVTTTINYVHGIDNTDDLNLRSRTVTYGSDNNVWKLGDVVNSTPRIVASVPLNKYDTVYSDTTYKSFISDNNAYLKRGMVFTGGNDGMLHAFRLGKLELSWTGKAAVEKARITNPYFGTTLGDEAWAFIPKNALPYLKYLKDPDYCHLYYVDLAPYVFDASIGSGSADQSQLTRTQASWRTVLIGGMRTGGACDNAVTCTTANNCVKTPEGGATGYSSYFALDVTDPTTPSLMWEFTNPGLGFTTTGPAVLRINAVNTTTSFRDRSLNGEWYVVFGSGPTGPIDNTNNQFLGRSNQNLKFFVLNLKTGALVQTIDTGITNAFAGSMINAVADFNIDYQDDAIYVGYVKRAGTSGNYTWTDGGVGRILTANTTPGSGNWTWSRMIDGTVTEPIGPITSAVARLQNTNFDTNWLFFGSGRYFFENPPTGTDTTPEIDDATGQRRLYGIKDPCFSAGTINPTYCATVSPISFSALTNATVNTTALTEGTRGWYINLEASGNYSYDNTAARLFRSERVITDPLATTSGVVFFTTYKPYGDECALGGKSFLWALRYNTGDAPSTAVMQGKALVQVSTASVEQIDLSKAFKAEFGGGDGRKEDGGHRGRAAHVARVVAVVPTPAGQEDHAHDGEVRKRALHGRQHGPRRFHPGGDHDYDRHPGDPRCARHRQFRGTQREIQGGSGNQAALCGSDGRPHASDAAEPDVLRPVLGDGARVYQVRDVRGHQHPTGRKRELGQYGGHHGDQRDGGAHDHHRPSRRLRFQPERDRLRHGGYPVLVDRITRLRLHHDPADENQDGAVHRGGLR
jgi:type IV pilus assembly protein PilY1